MTILLTNATGRVGSCLARVLSAHEGVAAIVRSDASARRVQELGLRPVWADFGEAASLDAAMNGIERLFLLTPPALDHAAVELRILDSAERNGVKRVVKLSLARVELDTPLSSGHRVVEERARAAFEATMLRPDYFNQNLLGAAPTLRAGRFVNLIDTWVTPIDARDIAQGAAAALTSDSNIGGGHLITGKDHMNFEEMTRRIANGTGKNVEFVGMEPEEYRRAAVATGGDPHFVDALVDFYVKARGGGGPTDGVRLLTGHEPREFDEFVRVDLAAALAQAT
jgi:uncharacterized protein YbjT (DUF2867 family)